MFQKAEHTLQIKECTLLFGVNNRKNKRVLYFMGKKW